MIAKPFLLQARARVGGVLALPRSVIRLSRNKDAALRDLDLRDLDHHAAGSTVLVTTRQLRVQHTVGANGFKTRHAL